MTRLPAPDLQRDAAFADPALPARPAAEAATRPAPVRSELGGRDFEGLGLRFEVHLGDVGVLAGERDWQDFETGAVATLFQTWRWLDAWTRTAGRAHGEVPVIAIGRLPTGAIAMIWPLARSRRLGRPVLTWLGQSHLSYAMPLSAPALQDATTAAEFESVIGHVARIAGADAVYLTDQPVTWDGVNNAVARSGQYASPNDSFKLPLAADFDAQCKALFSSKTRSQLRRKTRRLSDLAPVSIADAGTLEQRLAWLDVFISQKRAQLAEQGAASVFDRPEIQAFYRDLADDQHGRRSALQITALTVGERVAALALAMRHGNRVYMLNTSIASDADLAESSPGKLLIHAHVEACHRAGATVYDFGPGEAAYKTDWHAQAVPLSALVRGVTIPGRAVALALGGALTAKRVIKRTPRLWRAAQAARKMAARRLLSRAT